MASLFVIRGKDAGKHFSLIGERIVLGRDPHCDIQIVDTEVSRQHAAIEQKDGQVLLVDQASSNGTFVNASRIERQLLKSGDRLQLGRSLLVFNARESDIATSTASAAAVEIVVPSDSTPLSEDLSRIRRAIPGFDTGPLSGTGTEPINESSLFRIRSDVSEPDSTNDSFDNSWEIMYRTVLAVSRTMDIDQLLREILDFVFQGMACDRGCIMLSEVDPPRLRPVVSRNRQTDSTAPRIEISQTILDYVMKQREGVLTDNAGQDSRWMAGQSILGMGIREAICVPMLGRYGLVGAIYIDTSRKLAEYIDAKGTSSFTDEHLKLMIAIGHQAALAVEDTYYYRGMVQAERLAAMGQTIATLSHHVKNILQGINGGSYLVQEGIKRERIDTIAKGWRIVEKNQERISALVMDMLTLSKERAPDQKSVDLRLIIEDCIELIEPRSEELGIEIIRNLPAVFPNLLLDPEGIHRAILNVLTNAVDALYETESPRIEIRLRSESNKAYLEIIDNGPGIAAEDLAKIFSLFESSKGNRGTGLGLPVSQKILREHGGEIEVVSQLGGGSRFILVLPIESEDSHFQESADRPTEMG
jgi:signal transduction histidine kinase/pSer/pThr/pTyr-binding forkhead associated (FHA) protein